MQLNSREHERAAAPPPSCAASVSPACSRASGCGSTGFLGRTGRHLALAVREQYIRLQRLAATRGLIYDRNGEPLVGNRASFDVVVSPVRRDLAETIRRVARFLRADLNVKQLNHCAARGRPPAARGSSSSATSTTAPSSLPRRISSASWHPASTQGRCGRTLRSGHRIRLRRRGVESELGQNPGYRSGRPDREGGRREVLGGAAARRPGGQQIGSRRLGRKLRVLCRACHLNWGNNMVPERRPAPAALRRAADGGHGLGGHVIKPTTGEISRW